VQRAGRRLKGKVGDIARASLAMPGDLANRRQVRQEGAASTSVFALGRLSARQASPQPPPLSSDTRGLLRAKRGDLLIVSVTLPTPPTLSGLHPDRADGINGEDAEVLHVTIGQEAQLPQAGHLGDERATLERAPSNDDHRAR
jgi:hypothetical protein